VAKTSCAAGWAGKLRRILTALALVTGLAGAPIALTLASAAPAGAADADTYSWPTAPCAWTGATTGKCVNTRSSRNTDYWFDWGVTSCPPGDTYCSATINGYIQYDQWGYEFRNSTSYVAQKISQEFAGRNVAGWGNAGNWKKAALNAGYHTDSSPQAGDIAVWNTSTVPPGGQVAYVYAVSGRTASFDEYNAAQTGAFTSTYTSATHPGGAPTWYIHMGTPGLSPSPTTSPSPTPTTSPSPPPSTPPASGGYTVYVSTLLGEAVPINTATNTAGTPIEVGGPYMEGIDVAPGGTEGYAYGIHAAGAQAYFVPFNLATGAVGASTEGDGVAFAPGGTTGYVADNGEEPGIPGTVTPINLATNTLGAPITVGDFPTGIVFTPGGTTAYVLNRGFDGPGSVTPINTATNTAGPPIPVGTNPGQIVITPDGTTLYVLNSGSGTVTPINTATNTAGAAIPVGIPIGVNAGQMVFAPGGTTAYVASGAAKSPGTVTPVNVATGTAGAAIPVGLDPGAIVFTPGGATAYVANSGSGTVTPINVATGTAGAAIPVGLDPGAIVFTPNGTTAYVLNSGSDTVTPINVATGTAGAAIPVGADPIGLVIAP
jgi:YVTN family beta-propeller protein